MGWRPHALLKRPVLGSTQTAETLCPWRASLAQARSRRTLSRRGTLKPCATAPGLVKLLAVLAQTPHAVSQPVCSATLAAPLAGPRGARPTWAVAL